MKIHYSPYFNGHAFIDYAEHKGGLLGECAESTNGLLSRLELVCGLSYPDFDEEKIQKARCEEYYSILKNAIKPADILYPSFQNDSPTEDRLNVTKEILLWRDSLIMAGWDKTSPLPGKLSLISNAEPQTQSMTKGIADRWLDLSQHVDRLSSAGISICLDCPEIIIPSLILSIINPLIKDQTTLQPGQELDTSKISLFYTQETYQAYQYLANTDPVDGQVIVCADGDRLDSVMQCFGKPITSKEAAIGCHHIIDDVRCVLDAPQSLVWLDCNGDYSLQYPYHFLSQSEIAELVAISLKIPSESEMLSAVHDHIISTLNSVKGNVTIIYSLYDNGTLLPTHPVVSMLTKDSSCSPSLLFTHFEYDDDKEVIKFEPQSYYDLEQEVTMDTRMSYSSLDKLIQHPFDFFTEKVLDLKEPYSRDDLQTAKGTIAHRVVELMVNDGRAIDMDKFDEKLNEALTTDKYGNKLNEQHPLTLPENKFEKDNFELTLRESLLALQNIIKDNGLEIVGSEVNIPVKSAKPDDGTASDEGSKPDKKASFSLEGFGPSMAEIDMVLKKGNDYYIFDFKNSTSKRYMEKLEEDKSIQFAFYKHIFEQYYAKEKRQVKGIGYYLFPKCTLYVPKDLQGELKGDNVVIVEKEVESSTDILTLLKNSYKFRKEEIEKGKIEEAEKTPASDLDYTKYIKSKEKLLSEESLFPLEIKSNKKKEPYSSTHIVMKNQIR